MAREKVDNKLNVVIGTKAQVEADNTIPENSIVIVTDEELTASDIPQLAPSKITQDANNRFVTDNEKSTWNGKVTSNSAITGATKAKITYDSKGLVTSGDDLVESDIPTLSASKITQTSTARFVTDNEKSTWNGKQNALTAGDGISISGNVISADSGLTVEGWDTATKTLELSDANKLIYCSYTDNQTLTIPAGEDVAFPIGTMITFLLTSTYKVTFAGSHSGVDIMSIDSLVELATQYGMASLIKLGPNTWQLVGTDAHYTKSETQSLINDAILGLLGGSY